MPVTPLQDLARVAMGRYADSVYGIGDLPYHFCRSFLIKIRNADQLRAIEQSSEHVKDNDGEIWQLVIAATFPNYAKFKQFPKEEKSSEWWSKFYNFIEGKVKEDDAAGSERLRRILAAKEEEKMSVKTKILGPNLNRNFEGNRRPYSRTYTPKATSSAPRKPFQPTASKVPKKVSLGSDLLAERKAQKLEREASKKIPRALRISDAPLPPTPISQSTIPQRIRTFPASPAQRVVSSRPKIRGGISAQPRPQPSSGIQLNETARANLLARGGGQVAARPPTERLSAAQAHALPSNGLNGGGQRQRQTQPSTPQRLRTAAEAVSAKDPSRKVATGRVLKRKSEADCFMPPRKR